ncbi:hypothetical protein RFI_39166 [Reticulomyxa filosa]|uniref:Uncharacterized protein n=1 Tax=Reticulomyxa filosa TaxID=46433 RepID=X6LC90_RETFI|nr:hypothetical protein RFI_39166 [Reticulomyxa filosa]|eukprot:ETN98344.1 hypothetical protein RFI_39166 [Reticulomyxa filosa]
MTDYIVIGGDCNAHHSAWLDQNTDDVIVFSISLSNGLHIINTLLDPNLNLEPNVLLMLERQSLVFELFGKAINLGGVTKINKQLRRKLLLEKHQHMMKSIDSLHEGNTRNLFTQFKSLNTNKICIIPALVNKETNSYPDCIWCEEEETVEHFLIECLKYQDLRRYWWTNVQTLLPDINVLSLSMKYFIIGVERGNQTLESRLSPHHVYIAISSYLIEK